MYKFGFIILEIFNVNMYYTSYSINSTFIFNFLSLMRSSLRLFRDSTFLSCFSFSFNVSCSNCFSYAFNSASSRFFSFFSNSANMEKNMLTQSVFFLLDFYPLYIIYNVSLLTIGLQTRLVPKHLYNPWLVHTIFSN